MARHFDRIKDTSTTTGTGNVTVSGTPPTGYLTFSSVLTVGDEQVPYCIAQQASAEWETGMGTYFSANVLRRDTITGNSAGTFVAINFSAGTKDVFLTVTAGIVTFSGDISAQVRGLALP